MAIKMDLRTILGAFGLYVGVVNSLRHRRSKSLASRMDMPNREAYSKMRVEQAQMIISEIFELEFPFFSGLSVTFALFKVSWHSE